MSAPEGGVPNRFDPADTVPLFRQSLAKVLVNQSPKHCLQAYLDSKKTEVKPSTPAQLRGSLIDAMLFGIGMEKYQVIDVDSYTTKAGKAARDAVLDAGLVPVKRKHYDAHLAAVEAIHTEMKRHGIVLSGKSQVYLEWDSIASDGTPVSCGGTLDHLILGEDSAIIYDLKTLESATADAIARKMVEFGSHIQRAAYVEAVETVYPKLAGRVNMLFLYAEINPPYDLNPAAPAGSMRELGDRQWRYAVSKWAGCLKTGVWPGYCHPGNVTMIEAKPWDLARAMVDDVTTVEDENA